MKEESNINEFPLHEWIDVRDDSVYEKFKASLNDWEGFIVVSKTRTKITSAVKINDVIYNISYWKPIRPKYVMRIDVDGFSRCKDGYEYETNKITM